MISAAGISNEFAAIHFTKCKPSRRYESQASQSSIEFFETKDSKMPHEEVMLTLPGTLSVLAPRRQELSPISRQLCSAFWAGPYTPAGAESVVA
jgi:hypothetical protein